MAIKLEDKLNTIPPDVTYPFGDIKDDPGDDTGTPVNRAVYADHHQFFAKLLDNSGIVINDLPDDDVNGFQLFDALLATNTIQSSLNNDRAINLLAQVGKLCFNAGFSIL